MEEGAPTRRKVAPNGSILPYKDFIRAKRSNLHPTQKRGVASKKVFMRRRKGKKGEAKGKGKRVKAGFEVREKAVLRELKQVFKRGWKHSRQDKKAFYTALKRNRNGARRKVQTRARVPQSGDKG